MASIEPIQSLWRSHGEPDSRGIRGFEVEGIELATTRYRNGRLCADVSGARKPGSRLTAILGLFYGDLVVVARALDGEAKAYFEVSNSSALVARSGEGCYPKA